MKQSKQQIQQRAAAERREAKRIKHERMMAAQTAKFEAQRAMDDNIAQWESARDNWYAAGQIGPRPIHPLDVGTGGDNYAFNYDLAMGHYVIDDGDDLMIAAAELGIEIAA